MKLDLISVDEAINPVPDPIEKINIANGIATCWFFKEDLNPRMKFSEVWPLRIVCQLNMQSQVISILIFIDFKSIE
jgi:hypothetical protein